MKLSLHASRKPSSRRCSGLPMRPTPQRGLGRLLSDVQSLRIPDILDDDADHECDLRGFRLPRSAGFRTWLSVPMLLEGNSIGAIVIYR